MESRRQLDQDLAMKAKSIISGLHAKYAEKTWNETFQLVRRCMDKSRNDGKPCEPLARSLERLQEVLNVSSLHTMTSRLETIAKQRGMGFHITESTCYLTADLFYLEVVLRPCGGAEDVKVAPHGGAPVSSESLLQLLRSKRFAEFSVKLERLFSQYSFPGDHEVKLKLYASLQHLSKDLQELARVPVVSKDGDPHVDVINNGIIGRVTAEKEDCPLTLHFYMIPADGEKSAMSDFYQVQSDQLIQAAQVGVASSEACHQLQMAPVIPLPPQLDAQGRPVFTPPDEAPHEMLPACFLLRLQPPVAMMRPFVDRMRQITDVVAAADLQWEPFPELLLQGSSGANSRQMSDEQDAVFSVLLPFDVAHRYVFPAAAWEAAAHRGTLLTSVTFSHPAQVPALVELLRHQCAINALLRSCTGAAAGSACEQHFEVLLESDCSFSVTFSRPDTESLAVLLVNIPDSRHITCSLFPAEAGSSSEDQEVSAVMQSCMSVPLTLRSVLRRLDHVTSAPPPPAAHTESPDDRLPRCGAATLTHSTATAAGVVSEEEQALPGSARCDPSVARTQVMPEIDASPAVTTTPHTLAAAAGVFPHWLTSNSPLPELL